MSASTKLPLLFLYTKGNDSIQGATRFQKLVFLAQEETKLKDYYSFHEDRFGPYSFELRKDLQALQSAGYIEQNLVTNSYGHSRIDYTLTPKGIREAKNLLTEDNRSVFDLVEGVKEEYNYEPIQDLLQYVYQKYDEMVTASEVDTGSLYDPDAISEFEQPGPATRKEPKTVGEKLRPTPHTLYQMPKRDTNAYFYYFTDDSYTESDSKYKALDDELTLFGRNRSGLEVAMIDRDRIRPQLWDTLTSGFGIDSYPALVVSDQELGVRDTELGDQFDPNDGNYAILENGLIQDEILKNSDAIRDFLNTMFDHARRGEMRRAMQKEKVLECLSVTKSELQRFISFPLA